MAKTRTGRTCIGISGWTYAGWRGVFYPEGLARKRELAYAGSRMNTIEINGSFYSLQRPTSYRAWYEAVPDDFVFAVKGSRFITHMKKLKDVDDALANFLASGVLRLADKLGPVLWQFPERMKFDEGRFADFLARLPRTHAEASILARGHDARLDGRAWTEPEHEGPIRHAFEVRHPGFLSPAFVDLLAAHNAAFVFADTAGKWPYAEDVTGDFVYVRLHGAEELYASGYSDEQLDWWAARIREWRCGCHPGDAACVAPALRMRPPAATCLSTLTTTPRCTRPLTRCAWPSGCADRRRDAERGGRAVRGLPSAFDPRLRPSVRDGG